MSQHTTIYYGYGINVSRIKTEDPERIRDLLACAPEYAAKVEKELAEKGIDDPSADDYLTLDSNEYEGIGDILYNVICEAEHVGFILCQETDTGSVYLLFAPAYPWQYITAEKSLTEEKLDEILVKYTGIVSDDVIRPSYEEVEYDC